MLRTKASALLAAGIVITGASVAACTPKHTITESQTSAVLNSQQGKQVQAAVEACIQKGGGHKAVENCIIPGSNKAAFRICAAKALASDFASDPKLKAALTLCVVTAVND